MPKSNVKIEYAIVCDDVRREDNGKLIIIGVYATDIRVSKYPLVLPLSLVMAIRSTETRDVPINVRLLQDGERTFEAKGGISFTRPDSIGMWAFSGIPVQAAKDVALDFEAQIDGGRWRSVCQLPVRKIES